MLCRIVGRLLSHRTDGAAAAPGPPFSAGRHFSYTYDAPRTGFKGPAEPRGQHMAPRQRRRARPVPHRGGCGCPQNPAARSGNHVSAAQPASTVGSAPCGPRSRSSFIRIAPPGVRARTIAAPQCASQLERARSWRRRPAPRHAAGGWIGVSNSGGRRRRCPPFVAAKRYQPSRRARRRNSRWRASASSGHVIERGTHETFALAARVPHGSIRGSGTGVERPTQQRSHRALAESLALDGLVLERRPVAAVRLPDRHKFVLGDLRAVNAIRRQSSARPAARSRTRRVFASI